MTILHNNVNSYMFRPREVVIIRLALEYFKKNKKSCITENEISVLAQCVHKLFLVM